MKHIWSVVCKKSTIEQETNLISLFDSLEQLNVQTNGDKPAGVDVVNVPMENEVVSFWFRENVNQLEKYSIKIEIIDPDNRVLNTYDNIMEFPKGMRRIRARVKSIAIPVTKSGIYFYRVSFKKVDEKDFSEAVKIPVEVIITSTKAFA